MCVRARESPECPSQPSWGLVSQAGTLGQGFSWNLPWLFPSSPANELEAPRIRLSHHLMYRNSHRGRGGGTGRGCPTPQCGRPRLCGITVSMEGSVRNGEGSSQVSAGSCLLPAAWLLSLLLAGTCSVLLTPGPLHLQFCLYPLATLVIIPPSPHPWPQLLLWSSVIALCSILPRPGSPSGSSPSSSEHGLTP